MRSMYVSHTRTLSLSHTRAHTLSHTHTHILCWIVALPPTLLSLTLSHTRTHTLSLTHTRHMQASWMLLFAGLIDRESKRETERKRVVCFYFPPPPEHSKLGLFFFFLFSTAFQLSQLHAIGAQLQLTATHCNHTKKYFFLQHSNSLNFMPSVYSVPIQFYFPSFGCSICFLTFV